MYGYRINEEIKRPEKELLKQFEPFTTADLCDGCVVFDAMDYQIKPYISTKKIIGPAVTVKVPSGEGDIVVKAIQLAREGDIIVIAGHGNCASSYWGDKRSEMAQKSGVAGVVVDGAFRDFEGCKEVGLPIFAKGLTNGSAVKSGMGEINVPVSCGQVVVNPGDIIVGDVNGVCVIPQEYAQEIIENTKKKLGLV
ncbi:MAG: RraA family protein [Clostridiaceae bacterium]|nr:RraA family protein [Clostridiaceae bacterium]